MKDTNAIEKALKKKVDREIELIVDSFVNTIEIQLRTKYNSNRNYYDLEKPSKDESFFVQGTTGLTTVLNKMLRVAHGEDMLNVKSKELINKLDLI